MDRDARMRAVLATLPFTILLVTGILEASSGRQVPGNILAQWLNWSELPADARFWSFFYLQTVAIIGALIGCWLYLELGAGKHPTAQTGFPRAFGIWGLVNLLFGLGFAVFRFGYESNGAAASLYATVASGILFLVAGIMRAVERSRAARRDPENVDIFLPETEDEVKNRNM